MFVLLSFDFPVNKISKQLKRFYFLIVLCVEVFYIAFIRLK